MLQTLRNNTRIILWVTIIAFVGLIVLVWGADFQTGAQNQLAVGSVNGEKIPRAVFDEVYRANLQNFRDTNDREMTFEDQRRLAAQSWDAVVSEMLIDQQAADLKIPVTDEEVVFWIQNNPPQAVQQSPNFQDAEGNYDHNRYLASLRTNPELWVGFEESIRSSLPATKLQQIVLHSAKVSRSEIEDFVRQLSEQRVISYARVDPNNFDFDIDSLTDAEVETYYQNHLDDYQSGERAVLRYVKIDKTASETDAAEVLEDCEGYAADVRRDLASGSERGRETFAALATNFSDGPRAESGGDSGPARTQDQIRPEDLAEQVFATPVGQVSNPFRIDDRYHLVFVTGEDESGARTYLNLQRDITAGPQQLADLRRQVTEAISAARSQDLSRAAAKLGMTVEETEPFAQTGFVPELLQFRDALQFAFQNDPGAIGGPDQSESSWLIYEVAERLESEPLPLEQVRASVRRAIANERKRELAREDAEALADAVASQGIETGARAVKAEVQQTTRFARRGPVPGVGTDNVLLHEVFELSEGETSGLIEGDTAFFVARTDSVIVASEEELEAQRQTARYLLQQERQFQIVQSWIETLREDADIVDERQGQL